MPIDALKLAEELIGYDTVSRNSNLAMVDRLAELTASLGFKVERFTSPDGNKSNLFATLGTPDEGGLMLAGHMDVVPVEGQAWQTDPFRLTNTNGRLYGRGSADMKLFIVQTLLAAEAVQHKKLKRPLHLAFTYDEEVGCGGANLLMAQMGAANHVMPACAVIGEPTNFQVFRMHKGFHSVQVRVKGVEGHSSKPHKGANAIQQIALVLNKVAEVAEERKLHRSMAEYFEVPHTTLNVGMIQGGTALNIIPNHCEVGMEYRTMPGEDPDYVYRQIQGYVSEVLLPDFKKQHADVDIEVELTVQGQPMMTDAGSDIERVVLELTANQSSTAAPYYTEGGIYNDAGIPTVICGPGDIDQAHRPNEFITLEQFEKGLPFLGRLIERVCL